MHLKRKLIDQKSVAFLKIYILEIATVIQRLKNKISSVLQMGCD